MRLRTSAVLSLFAASLLAAAATTTTTTTEDDPFLWLEEVEGARAMAWVKEQNQRTTSELESVKEFKPIFEETLEILDSKERIPYPTMMGGMIYNFWQDESHPRGIWRRTAPASYRSPEPQWETVIDVDALGKAEGVPWVLEGTDCLPPAFVRCMVSLSRGGSDASVYREFDTRKKAFVEGGFSLPEAKSNVAWKDENTLWVGTDFGPGSLMANGYPRIVKLWSRGTPLAEARTIFEARPEDVASYGYTQHGPDGRHDIVVRSPEIYRQQMFLLLGDRLVRLDLPEDSNPEGIFKDNLLLLLRTDWTPGATTYRQGSLLAVDLNQFLQGGREFDVLFEPTDRISLLGASSTRDRVLLSILDNVRGRLHVLSRAGGSWKREEVPLPGLGTMGLAGASAWEDTFFFRYSDFLTPSSLYVVERGGSERLKSLPDFFRTEGMAVSQHETVSKDGTRIPYFVLTPKGFKADGSAPALLYGYGGFEVPQVPGYRAGIGASWVQRGGVYVLANIRGGGEFGPRWHQAALKEKRMRSFEDFIAVAEDVVARKITSPPHLGIMGGSQGGLLVGGAFTLRPDLFGAVVAQIPLADMHRYHKLLAGASWMAEYGNPDVEEEWAYIKTWSPYHLLRKDAKYPKVFYWTTGRDDRVHPGHARKMAAKMADLGHPVYYFEQIEGGHGSGAINRQRAYTQALEYAYLWKMLR